MINFISYLLIFISIVYFTSFEILNIIYIVLNFILIISWFVVYLVNKKKYKQEAVKKEFDKSAILIVILICVANLVEGFTLVNLIFGFICYFNFMFEFIKCIKKKDLAFNNMNINNNRLFDIYSLVYLSGLLVSIMSYQI